MAKQRCSICNGVYSDAIHGHLTIGDSCPLCGATGGYTTPVKNSS